MATRTFTPPVGHGHHDMPAAVAHRSGENPQPRTVAGVRLTPTGIGYAAQGWRMEPFEASPKYWIAGRLDNGRRAQARTLTALVAQLVKSGDLDTDAQRKAAS